MLKLLGALFRFLFLASLSLMIGALIRWDGRSLNRHVEGWVFKMEKELKKSPSTKTAIKKMETWTAKWSSASPKKAEPSSLEDQKKLKNFLDSVD